jgi:hypothetical protein
MWLKMLGVSDPPEENPPSDQAVTTEPPEPAQSADDLPPESFDPGTPNDQFMLMQERANREARELTEKSENDS